MTRKASNARNHGQNLFTFVGLSLLTCSIGKIRILLAVTL